MYYLRKKIEYNIISIKKQFMMINYLVVYIFYYSIVRTYKVSSSEKLRKSGAEAETKALLYLMNFYSDSQDIHYFIVDFFNDLTGMNRTAKILWDLQSKGAKNSSPKSIGKELVTLFKNFISEINFKAYILFLGGVTSSFRIDNSKTSFGIENIKKEALELLIEGLIEECKNKIYIPNEQIKIDIIEKFISHVTFIIDEKKSTDYVRSIIKMHPHLMPEDIILEAIFNEIRDKQSSKKNINNVEGITIETTEDALDYCRHLTNNEIRLLTLQRILNWSILEKGIPEAFLEIYNRFPAEQRKDKLNECQANCCRALFNNNCADGFWTFFEKIYTLIIQHPQDSVTEIYRNIEDEILDGCPDLDVHSFKYCISIVKEGIQK